MKIINNFRYYSLEELKRIFPDFNFKKLESPLKKGKINFISENGKIFLRKNDFLLYQLENKSRFFHQGIIALNLDDVQISGNILDIGGGGEGIIGQRFGKVVTAIDKRKEELDEAENCKCKKLVMDATDMTFNDNSFQNCTAFFSLMYMSDDTIMKVFKEANRVLKNKGFFYIWDLKIPERVTEKEDIFIISIQVKVNENYIDTNYGIMWKNKKQDNHSIAELACKSGFSLNQDDSIDDLICLVLKKKYGFPSILK